MITILSIDQSTSATKAILFDLQGQLLDKVAVSHKQVYPKPGWVEHDADEIYQNTIQAIRTLLQKNKDQKYELLCLSITNQRETVVVFDRKTGKPVHNAIVWQCRRGIEICTELFNAGKNSIVQEKTGLPIDTYFSASKLKWLADNVPGIQSGLINGDILIGTIETYLIYRLTGGACFASDHTNACRTLLYNIKTLCWDDELCKIFGVPKQALPEVRESSARFGETDLGGLLPSPIPICGVMGDSQASLFAQRCFDPGTAKVTFGTGSSVLLTLGNDRKHSPNGIVTTLAYVYNGKTAYAFEGITNFTGATIAWLKDQLQLIQNSAETEKLATSVEDNGGVYLIPAFVGLGAPYWKPEAKAAILGLSPHSTRNHVVRAALESIAYRIRDVLELMIADAGIEMGNIYADGGAIQNQFLMQFVSDILQIDVRVSSLPELSALGAVFSGLLGMEQAHSLEDLSKLPRKYIEYKPIMVSDDALRLYSEWKSAVERVLL